MKLLATKKRFKLTDGEAPALDMAIKALELFPDNATNGDVIQALFPDAEFDNAAPFSDVRWETFRFKGLSRSDEVYKPTVLRTYRDWWNAPYKLTESEG